MNKEQEQLLIVKYLTTKISQAQKDLELFSVMLEEIKGLQDNKERAIIESRFIKLAISNKGEV